MKKENIIFILSAVSGTGKSSLVRNILLKNPNIELCISITTRKPRVNEVDGKDYFFVSKDKFFELIKNNQIIEYVDIFGNMYGISKEVLQTQLNKGKHLILVLTYDGVKFLQKYNLRNKIVTIFLFSPSFEELKRRLKLRGDSEKEIDERLSTYNQEISYVHNYDYILVNNVIADTCEKFLDLVEIETQKIKLLHSIQK